MKKLLIVIVAISTLLVASAAFAVSIQTLNPIWPAGSLRSLSSVTNTDPLHYYPGDYFTWSDVGANSYEIYIPGKGVSVLTVSDFSCSTSICRSNAFISTFGLENGKSYTWNIRSKTSGVYSAYTESTPVDVATSWEGALELLLAGNEQFKLGKNYNVTRMSSPLVRTDAASANGQRPYAIILACSDSRVAAEALFNKGIGEVFIVRVAGNVVDKHQLGSIEYAIEHLGAKLVIVLGHTKCGAVKTTYEVYSALNGAAYSLPACRVAAFGSGKEAYNENICSLAESIWPAATEVGTGHSYSDCVLPNVNNVAASLFERSAIITEAVNGGEVKVLKYVVDVSTGELSPAAGTLNFATPPAEPPL